MFSVFFRVPGNSEVLHVESKDLTAAQYLWDSLEASNFRMVSERP